MTGYNEYNGLDFDTVERVVLKAAVDLEDIKEAIYCNSPDKDSPVVVQNATEAVIEAAGAASLALEKAVRELRAAREAK